MYKSDSNQLTKYIHVYSKKKEFLKRKKKKKGFIICHQNSTCPPSQPTNSFNSNYLTTSVASQATVSDTNGRQRKCRRRDSVSTITYPSRPPPMTNLFPRFNCFLLQTIRLAKLLLGERVICVLNLNLFCLFGALLGFGFFREEEVGRHGRACSSSLRALRLIHRPVQL